MGHRNARSRAFRQVLVSKTGIDTAENISLDHRSRRSANRSNTEQCGSLGTQAFRVFFTVATESSNRSNAERLVEV